MSQHHDCAQTPTLRMGPMNRRGGYTIPTALLTLPPRHPVRANPPLPRPEWISVNGETTVRPPAQPPSNMDPIEHLHHQVVAEQIRNAGSSAVPISMRPGSERIEAAVGLASWRPPHLVTLGVCLPQESEVPTSPSHSISDHGESAEGY